MSTHKDNASPVYNNHELGNFIGVPVETSGAMLVQQFTAGRPLPCIVILVHGVNDTGEAYQHQEKGIVAGLNTRLARNDLHIHQWGELGGQTDLSNPPQRITGSGRSPVIPFHWGYRPVDHATWLEDQRRYREEVRKLGPDAMLPYDAWLENDAKRLKKLNPEGRGFLNDNFGNVLNLAGAKDGGTFANATTCLPDMLGPGAGGVATWLAGGYSRHSKFNHNDFTHPIYQNPHRIYQFFAAQRLADLILAIRGNKDTEFDTINIVAHSQGTLLAMLANMLVKRADRTPADCVILCHSPYSLEQRFMENRLPGRKQTTRARQQTFANFCNMMATNPKYAPDGRYAPDFLQAMVNDGTLGLNHHWHSDPRHSRNNFGRVYNYFCPDDGTVSLINVQGMGWRGIPDTLACKHPNLFQRVFSQRYPVGGNPAQAPFEKLPEQPGDFIYDSWPTNASYPWNSEVTVNGDALPEVFTFTLMGHTPDEGRQRYHSGIGREDRYIDYSARSYSLVWQVKENRKVINLYGQPPRPGQKLTDKEIAEINTHYQTAFTSGYVGGNPQHREYVLFRNKTDEEIDQMEKYGDPVKLSQHSSIVMSPDVPEKVMAWDLAIGNCMAFEDPDFWQRLIRQADWRHWNNPDEFTREYYKTGELNIDKTKIYMNKPDAILPTGEFGVVNEYAPAERTEPPRHPRDPHPQVTPLPQWDMPAPAGTPLPNANHRWNKP